MLRSSEDILTSLKQNILTNVSTMKTMYNARHKHRVLEQGGRSQIQHLLYKVLEANYIEWHHRNKVTDSVTDLFWTHPIDIELLCAFLEIIIIGCTYKTNMYNYPLLEIVGVTSILLLFLPSLTKKRRLIMHER